MTGHDRHAVGPLPLAVAAVASVVAAVATDVLADEHPTHTVALALVAIVVAILRVKVTDRRGGLFSAVSCALVAQPALHAVSKLGRPGVAHNHGDPLHVLATDGPTTAMQVAVPALVLVAIATCTPLVVLLVSALRRPRRVLRSSAPVEAPHRLFVPARAQRHGSMARWCGWTIRAPRRGPPMAVTTDLS